MEINWSFIYHYSIVNIFYFAPYTSKILAFFIMSHISYITFWYLWFGIILGAYEMKKHIVNALCISGLALY